MSSYSDESETVQKRLLDMGMRLDLDLDLRPFRVIHKNGRADIFLSAAGYDMAALKSGEYLGADEPVFGPDKVLDKTIGGIPSGLLIPEFCKQTVYRYTQHGTATFTGIVFAVEYINDVSHVRNCRMFLEKWAHCRAMRLAFADILGADVAAEELDANMDFRKGATGRVALTALADETPVNMHLDGSTTTLAGQRVPSKAWTTKPDVEDLIASVFP